MISGYSDLVTEEDLEVADVVIPKPFNLPVIDELIEFDPGDQRAAGEDPGSGCYSVKGP